MSSLRTPRSVFTPRTSLKPFEYPEILTYQKAINESHWWVTEFGNFAPDVHDFKSTLTTAERNLIRNAMLSISQVEVAVKMFWARLGDHFPKPEFYQVGVTLAENEVRHANAYSHLLTVLGLEGDFERMTRKGSPLDRRSTYLADILKSSRSDSNEDFLLTLAMFSLFIENVSLFSQFLVIKSFYQHSRLLKDIENVIQATQKEEQVHALFGVHLVRLVRSERPEWFGDRFTSGLAEAAATAYTAESEMLDWMFEMGDVGPISKESTRRYVRSRFDLSLDLIGTDPISTVFERHTSTGIKQDTEWMSTEMSADSNTDFFFKQPVGYTKSAVAFRPEDLF